MKVHPQRSGHDAPATVIRAASDWIARRDRGLTAAETEALLEWLRDEQHRAAFAQLESAFAAFDRLKTFSTDVARSPDPDAFAPRRRQGRWLFPSFVAAGLAAAAAIAVLLWQPEVPTPSLRLETAARGYTRAALADGSMVELNGDTIVEVEYNATERRARLVRGEAHFRVAKAAARPFRVVADSVTVRVVGTAFDVLIKPASIEVVVMDGTVEIERGPKPPAPDRGEGNPPATSRLSAGQKIVVPSADRAAPAIVVPVSPAQIEQLLAWPSRIAEFNRTPLQEAVAVFNRSSEGAYPRIVIGDEELASITIGGNFRRDQPEAFVRLLESSFGITADRSIERIVLKKSR